MIVNEQKLHTLLRKNTECAVYYFYSTEEYHLRKASAQILHTLTQQTGEDSTVVEGPVPSMEEVILAAGTISFFGTKRVVELPFVQPAAFSDKELKEFCELLKSTENAVFVITTLVADEKARSGKRLQTFAKEMEQLGLSVEIAPLGSSELVDFVINRAKELDTQIEPGPAKALIERCGTDLYLLEAELQKLAAASGYGVITAQLISEMAVRNVDADVFDMVRLVQAGRKVEAFRRLEQLLEQQNDPIAIAAALTGSYVDLYRVKLAQTVRKNYSHVHKDFGYKGSDWRLKKASEAASRLKLEQLEEILDILTQLDIQLKSAPTDKGILLQAALASMIQAGGRR